MRARLLALLVLLAFTASCARTAADIQRDYARETLAPRSFHVNTDTARPALQRRLHVRAWANNDYRKQNLRWEQRIRDQLGRANTILQAQFGMELVIDSVAAWEHDTPDDAVLDASLAALMQHDAADDANWVLGFVGARSFNTDWHHLGQAKSPGKHMVLRGTQNVRQRDWLDKRLEALPEKERDQLWKEMRLHTETLLVLHEWAHTLGSPHDGNGDYIMSPTYDPQIVQFSPASIEVIRLGLEHLNQPGREAEAAWQAARTAAIAAHPGAFQQEGAAPPVRPEAPKPAQLAKPARFNRVVEAQRLLRVGKRDEAEALLDAALANATVETEPDLLRALASVLLEAGRLTAAETIAAQLGFAPEGLTLRGQITRQRRVVGLQPGALPEHDEPAYGQRFEKARAALSGPNAPDGEAFHRDYPKVAGSVALQCALALNSRGGAQRGKKLCDAALQLWPETVLAHQGLVALARSHRDAADAVQHLETLLDLIPDFEPTWLELARALKDAGQPQKLGELAKRYATSFGKPLAVE